MTTSTTERNRALDLAGELSKEMKTFLKDPQTLDIKIDVLRTWEDAQPNGINVVLMPDNITKAVFQRTSETSLIYYALKDNLNDEQIAHFIKLLKAKNELTK